MGCCLAGRIWLHKGGRGSKEEHGRGAWMGQEHPLLRRELLSLITIWYWYSFSIGFNLKGMKVSHNSESIQIKEGVVWASQAVAINWTRFIKVAWCPLSSWWLSSHKRRWGYLEFTRSRPSFLFEYFGLNLALYEKCVAVLVPLNIF